MASTTNTSKFSDLTGQKFNRWTVVGLSDKRADGNRRFWLCVCECGNEGCVRESFLTHGRSRSCGCLRSETTIRRFTKHGQRATWNKNSVWRIWCNMIQRCCNPRNAAFANYGGRGISVCEAWMTSIESFVSDMGPRPSPKHSIERINNEGNYEPSNCRWATFHEQCRNKRTNRILTLDGEYKVLVDWAASVGMSRSVLECRLRAGLSLKEALSAAPRYKNFRCGTLGPGSIRQ